MRIRAHGGGNFKREVPASPARGGTGAFTFVEVLVATFVLGILAASIYYGLAAGTREIQSTRENLRATQIMLQKVEAIRLFTWSQVNDTNYVASDFTEDYDPLGVTNSTSGAKYRCFVTATTPAVGDVPEGYRTNLLTVTVTLYWTNNSTRAPMVHKREMQTRVARNGMQNYIWGAL
jgi:prepilin-type N-terminal cleavage/methylation domain-containing protein